MKEIVTPDGFSFGQITDENLKAAYLENGCFEVPACEENFISKKYDFVLQKWFESVSEQEIKSNRNEQIKSKYEFHKVNGWNAYQEFRAKIVSDIYDGKVTEEQAFVIEANLKVAYDRIAQNGDWKTARFELQQVVPFPDFVQFYYDLAINYIDQYILENYED